MRVSMSFPFKAALYVALLIAMVLSATQLYVPKASAIACCTFGNQCDGHAVCCYPYGEQQPCSPTKRNYCASACPLT
jgi:hypothetical protein